MHARPSFPQLSIVVTFIAAALLAGCSASVTPIEGEEGGGGTSTTATTTGAGGTGGGAGGGETSLCEADCSAIDTPDCLKSVCNDGSHPGTIGECVIVSDDGTTCDDGQFCTTNDSCEAGVCVGGPQNTCGMTGTDCQAVSCNESGKACELMPANEGNSCQGDDLCSVGSVCSSGVCTGGTPKDCFFAPVPNQCHVAVCDPSDGMCKPVVGNEGVGCVDQNDLCSEGNVCTAGVCQGGTPKDCSGLDQGCNNGICDAATGQCTTTPVAPGGTCFDGVPQCNAGTCDMNGTCVPSPTPDGSSCDDYDSCTNGDSCLSGICGGSPISNCTTYFEANFEGGCGGWTLGGEWECGVPTNVGPSAAYQGLNVLGTDLDDDYENGHTYEANYAQTPPISLASVTAPMLSYQHYVDTEGSSFDAYNVKISTDGGNTFSVLSTVNPPYNLTVAGQPGYGGHINAWENVTASLLSYVGQTIILRFSFRTDGSVIYPGVYIDDITVEEGPIEPIVISTPSLPAAAASNPYSTVLAKTGGTASSVWSITGGSNIAWLSINATTGELFGTPGLADLGPASVSVHVEQSGDPTNFDDVTFNFDVVDLFWLADFEGVCPAGWTLTGDWQCGAPTSGPGSAFSGSQCLATQIAGDYNNGQTFAGTTATSPSINLAGTTTPELSFWMWYQTETSFDGVNLKVSTDGGATYNLLTTVVPAYNQTLVSEQCWAGSTSGAWVEHVVDLTAFAGQTVHLRFGFRSDGSVVHPGIYIDDLAIAD